MKRIFLLVLAIIATTILVSAQQFIGMNLGYARPITQLNQPVVGQEKTLTPTAYNGFKIGFVYDATIVEGFGFSMGLNYTFAANATDWKSEFASIFPQVSSRGYYHQFEIPVDWQYKFEIAQRTWLILYTGPTLQYGLSLNEKGLRKDDKGNVSEYRDVNRYTLDKNDYLALKPLNVTWGIGAGFQYERYFLRGGYDFGLVNPYKSISFIGKDVNTRGRFDQWQIKLGIYFWER